MFCSHCGERLPDGASFCGSCGQRITSNAPSGNQYGSGNQFGGAYNPFTNNNFTPPQQNPYQQNPHSKPVEVIKFERHSRKALVWGIVSMALSIYAMGIFGIFAIIHASRALNLAKDKPYRKGKAITGLIFGIVSLASTAMSILIFILFLKDM